MFNNEDLISLEIEDELIEVKPDMSILECCQYLGYKIPRFCFHEILPISGNCRMCLIEYKNSRNKPQPSCTATAAPGDSIYVSSYFIVKLRESILEFLLAHHPLDCPICDQGGECDLQDQSFAFGSDDSRFRYVKKAIVDKVFNPLINVIMARCINCTRCVRFSELIGDESIGVTFRTKYAEISKYFNKSSNQKYVYDNAGFVSELAGNVVDLCPVGALTSKNYEFKQRPWSNSVSRAIDITDGICHGILLTKDDGLIQKIEPNNSFFSNFITDKARYSFDALYSNNRIIDESFKMQPFVRYFKNSYSLLATDILKGLKNENKVLTLIDNNISFEDFKNLKKETKLIRSSKYYDYTNSYFANSLSFFENFDIEDSRYCFIFASNVKIENALINYKILEKTKNFSFDVFYFGLNKKDSLGYSSKFINISTEYFINILVGKSKQFSNLFLSSNPIFIFGENIYNYISGYSFLKNFFFSLNPSAYILFLNKNNNSLYYNIKSLSSKFLLKSKFSKSVAHFYNFDDNFLSRKISNDFKIIFRQAFHFSNKLKNIISIPSIHSLEYFDQAINIEKRIVSDSSLNIKEEVSLKNLFLNSFEKNLKKDGFIVFFNQFFKESSNPYLASELYQFSKNCLKLSANTKKRKKFLKISFKKLK